MTAADLEAGAADSAASFIRPRKKPFTHQGEPCKNCGTPLEGWYCYSCGQNADTHHRSILHLIWEAIEGMFHLDGRLANTLPLLFFRPGKLAKDYMEGRIVRHVPPFRTFLVALLLFIFAAEHAIHSIKHLQEQKEEKEAAQLATPQGRKAKADEMRKEAVENRDERLKDAVETRDEDLKEEGADKAKITARYDKKVRKTQERYAETIAEADALEKNPNAAAEALARIKGKNDKAAEQIRGIDFKDGADMVHMTTDDATGETTTNNVHVVAPQDHGGKHVGGWFKEGLAKAVENPDYYMVVMFGWAHRLAVLLLPIIGLSLALVYVNKRQYFIYDHLLVATNLLSFSFLVNAIGMVLPMSAWPTAFGIVSLWTPINLFQTLRGGYGSSIFGALLKTFVVWTISVTSFGVLLTALMLFSLSQM
ncbi:DUF3667 domain-containing protein [Caulobacter sp. 1776]|uniref:DUF3667 domain-containing protein n=1 Tax=Caulobacter sp. 1776 TaxID=3156420 RepID=UPI00339471CE